MEIKVTVQNFQSPSFCFPPYHTIMSAQLELAKAKGFALNT